ncbi:MAG: nuclear transport factor 2 family protein [Parvibaculaceae bacterium]|nr:nuclear transport factor 2 family protein [Parvibaculaceae bacterium]
MPHLKFALVLLTLLPAMLLFSVTAQAMSLPEAVQAYGEAWASRDVDRIVALHTEDSIFTLHIAGQEPAVGRAQIRSQFQAILESTPDYASKPYQMDFGPNFVVIMYRVLSGPSHPATLGAKVFTPNGGKDYTLDAIDLIVFDDGLVSAKHTFIDLETIRDHSSTTGVTAQP